MPRKRSGRNRGREGPIFANRPRRVAPRYSDFDESWLRQYSERQWSRLVDLTKIEDRRRWHPNRLSQMPIGPAPKGLQNRPRFVIVPEGHSLARLAPYGARVPIKKLMKQEKRTRRRSLDWFTEQHRYDRYGGKYAILTTDHVSRRVGFQHPWQVIVCVRRKKRREVLFALGKGGRGGNARRVVRRNEFSEVRC